MTDERGAPLRVGKLPPDLLAQLLEQTNRDDSSVVLGPRVGEDAALIDNGGENYLVVSSDPITFAADQLGWYAVHVNANDIAATGGTPRWMVMTVILPDGSPAQLAQDIMRQTMDACAEIGVSLVGGHTEVTNGIDRPIAAGMMVGEVAKGKETLSSGVRPGNAMILTKGVGIEGTAVLARESADRLRSAGVSPAIIERAAEFLRSPGISVVRDAATAVRAAPIHAMHDPTEGGVATALHEMADASGVGLLIDFAALSDMVLPETSEVCRALDIDPLGLIASGALLICVRSDRAASVVAALQDEGIRAATIGHATDRSEGLRFVKAAPDGTVIPLPRFDRDEVTRALGG